MQRPSWGEASGFWAPDGSLRDVYVKDAGLDDWRNLVDLARACEHTYSLDGETKPLPSVGHIFSDRDGHHVLGIHLGAVVLNTHFFVPDEIELDIDPKQIEGPGEHATVFDFLERIAKRLKKPVCLTPENHPDEPYVTYAPALDRWEK